jgi:ribonuclease T1
VAFGRAAAVSEGRSSTATSLQKLGLAFCLAFSLFSPAHARDQLGADAVVALAALPEEARQTEQRIRSGGPLAYAKDGAVFANREGLLPRQARGYYREYTVPTPGSRDRGARRIVCGGHEARAPDICYYSADHYASFERIVH